MNKIIYLAGGCFWGVEKYFGMIQNITSTEVGYANGPTPNPSYEDVCKKSGHAEVVKVQYDSEKISLDTLLNLFYKIINPTSYHKQGGDVGIQYRTGVYYIDESDLPIILTSINKLQNNYDDDIQIEVLPLENYYKAEEYHQKYLIKNPSGYCHITKNHYDFAKNFKSESLL